MPEFILYVATTLDGYIAKADGSIDWLTAFETDGEELPEPGRIAFGGLCQRLHAEVFYLVVKP